MNQVSSNTIKMLLEELLTETFIVSDNSLDEGGGFSFAAKDTSTGRLHDIFILKDHLAVAERKKGGITDLVASYIEMSTVPKQHSIFFHIQAEYFSKLFNELCARLPWKVNVHQSHDSIKVAIRSGDAVTEAHFSLRELVDVMNEKAHITTLTVPVLTEHYRAIGCNISEEVILDDPCYYTRKFSVMDQKDASVKATYLIKDGAKSKELRVDIAKGWHERGLINKGQLNELREAE